MRNFDTAVRKLFKAPDSSYEFDKEFDRLSIIIDDCKSNVNITYFINISNISLSEEDNASIDRIFESESHNILEKYTTTKNAIKKINLLKDKIAIGVYGHKIALRLAMKIAYNYPNNPIEVFNVWDVSCYSLTYNDKNKTFNILKSDEMDQNPIKKKMNLVEKVSEYIWSNIPDQCINQITSVCIEPDFVKDLCIVKIFFKFNNNKSENRDKTPLIVRSDGVICFEDIKYLINASKSMRRKKNTFVNVNNKLSKMRLYYLRPSGQYATINKLHNKNGLVFPFDVKVSDDDIHNINFLCNIYISSENKISGDTEISYSAYILETSIDDVEFDD